MSPRIFNVFINSKNRLSHETVDNFNIYFASGELCCTENQYITINVVSFDMMNSMYNVNAKNNSFQITQTDLDGTSNPITTNYTIPSGNYSVLTFKDKLNSLLTGVVAITYNTAQNTYTFTLIAPNTNRYFLNPLNTTKLIGLDNKIEMVSSGITGKFVNMVSYNKIIIRTENLNFDYFGYENIKDGYGEMSNSDILFWRSKQDVEPFKMISYNNEDASTSFKYDLYNTSIDYIHLNLTNEYNEPLTDAGDYMLFIQFIVNDRNTDKITESCMKIVHLLNDIYYLLLNGLSHFGFFKSLK